MVRRLKLKFILVIMAIVTLLFGAIFGMVMHLTRRHIEMESIQMMRGMAFKPPGAAPFQKPDAMPDNIRLPFFTVTVSSGGEILQANGAFFDLTDRTQLTELVSTVRSSSDSVGILPAYDLRYLRSETGPAETIVFADISSERAMLRGLIRNSLLIGLIGYAVFFAISVLLAEWVTKPVQKAWEEQKQFVADASHELKTPLTIIMTNAEMLGENRFSEADQTILTGNILSASRRMRGLVESLLTLARLDHSKAALIRKRIDLSRLVNESLLEFEPLFYESGMTLDSAVEGNVYAEGDAKKLTQVMSILLDNALKYDDPAFPVRVVLKSQTGQSLLCVAGHGVPLSRADCRNIFKRFYRVDQARNDAQSYGLGLSIAESILREHGGSIWAEHKNGENCFYASLPLPTRKQKLKK